MERLFTCHVHAGICDPPCVNGACVGNNTCSCSEAFTGEFCDMEGKTTMIIIVSY